MNGTAETVILWRALGPEEQALMRPADMRAFLPEQPSFYTVTTEAVKIARDWNVPASGVG